MQISMPTKTPCEPLPSIQLQARSETHSGLAPQSTQACIDRTLAGLQVGGGELVMRAARQGQHAAHKELKRCSAAQLHELLGAGAEERTATQPDAAHALVRYLRDHRRKPQTLT